MKKALIVSIFLCYSSSLSFAANPFDAFKDQLTGVTSDSAKKNLDAFAKDLGPVIAGGSFHQAKTLGFPGFDVGIHVPVVNVDKDNAIVKAANVDSLAIPVIQAEIGLPGKMDLIGRFTSYADASLVGVGLRYGIIKGDLPGVPSVAVQTVYNTLNVSAAQNKLTASTLSTAVTASLGLLVVNPYVGVSYDMTTVEPDSSVISGVKGEASGTRIEGGVNMTLFPLTYLQLGAVLGGSDVGYVAGFGVTF